MFLYILIAKNTEDQSNNTSNWRKLSGRLPCSSRAVGLKYSVYAGCLKCEYTCSCDCRVHFYQVLNGMLGLIVSNHFLFFLSFLCSIRPDIGCANV